MELEAADRPLADQLPRLGDTFVATSRIDAGEGDEHVGMTASPFDHVLVAHPGLARGEGGVDREHDCHHPSLPVVGGDLVDGGQAGLAPEVAGHRGPQLGR